MGTKGKAIVGVDVNKLLTQLNKALADEWLAYYQYWVGAKVAVGRMRGIIPRVCPLQGAHLISPISYPRSQHYLLHPWNLRWPE